MTKIMLLGDTHGDLKFAKRAIKAAHYLGINQIYQLGDFGFLWNPNDTDALAELNAECDLYGVGIQFIDGNHENFVQLYEYPIDPETGMRQITDYIWHLPRGYRWEMDGKTWMALGGATSLDRPSRIPGQSWWAEEELTLSDVFRAATPGPVDVMLTHDAPSDSVPGLNPAWWPVEEIERADKHRKMIDSVVTETETKLLFHGHFHMLHEDKFWGTTVVGLACNNDPLNDAAIVVDTETLQYVNLEAATVTYE